MADLRTNPPGAPQNLPGQIVKKGPVGVQWRGQAPALPDSSADASVRVGMWSVGTFDLRSELANAKENDRHGADKLWGPTTGLHVFMRIRPWTEAQIAAGASLKYMRIMYYEAVSAHHFDNMYPSTGEIDVTMQFTIGNPPHYTVVPVNDPTTAGMGGQTVFSAPGGPFRYWQPYLIFRIWKRMADPVIELEAAVY